MMKYIAVEMYKTNPGIVSANTALKGNSAATDSRNKRLLRPANIVQMAPHATVRRNLTLDQ